MKTALTRKVGLAQHWLTTFSNLQPSVCFPLTFDPFILALAHCCAVVVLPRVAYLGGSLLNNLPYRQLIGKSVYGT
jgi:hypothetical protein